MPSYSPPLLPQLLAASLSSSVDKRQAIHVDGDLAKFYLSPLPPGSSHSLASTVPLPSLLNSSTQSLHSDAVVRTPSIGSYTSDPSTASCTTASSKSERRRARRELNRERRKAEAEAKVAATKLPWDVALDALPIQHPRPATPTKQATVSVPVTKYRGMPIPARTYTLNDTQVTAHVQTLIADYGAWSITFADPSYRIFLTLDTTAALLFKLVSGLKPTAVVFGDPVCAPSTLPAAVAEFTAFCKAHHWRTVFVGVRASRGMLGIAERNKWATIESGTEQLLHPATNPVLAGVSGKRMSTAVKPLASSGRLRIYIPAHGRDTDLEAKLQQVYDTACAAKEQEKGSSTAYSTKLALFALPSLVTFLYTLSPTGTPEALAGLMQVSQGRYLLDPVFALPTAAPHSTDFLTLCAARYLARIGARDMSFGLEPLRELGRITRLSPWIAADTRLVNTAVYDCYGFGGKKTLHDKFHPESRSVERLFIVLDGRGAVGQCEGARAIWEATHLRFTSGVFRRIGGLARKGCRGGIVGHVGVIAAWGRGKKESNDKKNDKKDEQNKLDD